MKREKIIPQFALRLWCAVIGHKQVRYSAWEAGTQVVVYTCRCGHRQSTKILAANRKIRRHR